MTINVVIERLVLDETILGTPHQGRVVGDALQTELTRLLTEGRLAPHIMAGGLIPRLDGGVFSIGQGVRADTMGEQLARPIAGALR